VQPAPTTAPASSSRDDRAAWASDLTDERRAGPQSGFRTATIQAVGCHLLQVAPERGRSCCESGCPDQAALLGEDGTCWYAGELPISGTWDGRDQVINGVLTTDCVRLARLGLHPQTPLSASDSGAGGCKPCWAYAGRIRLAPATVTNSV
jgi:hypothetical protein